MLREFWMIESVICMKIKSFHQDNLEELPFAFKRSVPIILRTISSVQQLFVHFGVVFNRNILLNQDQNNNDCCCQPST